MTFTVREQNPMVPCASHGTSCLMRRTRPRVPCSHHVSHGGHQGSRRWLSLSGPRLSAGPAATPEPPPHASVTVLGGGSAGLCTALRFAAEGRTVAVVDPWWRERPFAVSPDGLLRSSTFPSLVAAQCQHTATTRWWSGLAASLRPRWWPVVSTPVPAAVGALQALVATSVAEYQSLLQQDGLNRGFVRQGHGALVLYGRRDAFRRDAAQRRWMRGQKIGYGELHPPQARALVARLDDKEVAHALLLRQDAFVPHAAALVEAMRRELVRRGAALLQPEAVDVVRRAGRVQEVVVDGTPLATDALVVAAGPRSAQYAAGLGDHVPVSARTVYQEEWKVGGGGIERPLLVPEMRTTLSPCPSGVVVTAVAATDGPQDQDALPQGVRAVVSRMLGFADDECRVLSSSSGSVDVTPDGLPVIGPSPTVRNVWYNFGHGDLEFSLAGASSRLVRELVGGERPFLPVEPYSADRWMKA